jgi:hypothetical protein
MIDKMSKTHQICYHALNLKYITSHGIFLRFSTSRQKYAKNETAVNRVSLIVTKQFTLHRVIQLFTKTM